jgi:hypothetical protein
MFTLHNGIFLDGRRTPEKPVISLTIIPPLILATPLKVYKAKIGENGMPLGFTLNDNRTQYEKQKGPHKTQ